MDKNRLKSLCVEALNLSYKGNAVVTEFEVLPTHEYNNEISEWVQTSHSLFLTIKRSNDYLETDDWRGIERFLESLLGLECSINFI